MRMITLSLLNFAMTYFLLPSWSVAQATYLYEKSFTSLGQNYIDLLKSLPTDAWENLPQEKRNFCEQRYRGILEDGILDVRIALGYFDWTTGSEVLINGKNYGLSPSMDLGAYAALKKLLTSSCAGKTRFCGFKQDSDNIYRFTREVQIEGRKYPARVEVFFSSASEYLNSNVGSDRRLQQERTLFMEKYFEKSLQNADALFYFGHSRNGGGPDFAPPVFIRGQNKLNYQGYYIPQRPGLKRMMGALGGSDKKAPIIGLMSCASREHFLNKVRSVAPGSGVITSTDVLYVDEVFTATIGAVDAILRGQCQKSFYQSLRMTAANQKYITMDGMFE